MSGRILVGRFGAPHGVRGAIRLQSFTAEPAAIGSYGTLSDREGLRSFRLRGLRAVKADLFVTQVEGVADRDAAAALTGLELYVDRAMLPPPDDDEFYLADLIGLEARMTDGTALGCVVAVPNFGAGDLLEIAPPSGDTRLLPFTRAVVPEIDVAGGWVRVVPPPEIEAREGDGSPTP